MIAAQLREYVAWIVLLAAPATKGEDTLLNQSDLIARAGGLSDAQLLASLNFDRQAYDLVRTGEGFDSGTDAKTKGAW